MLKIIYGRFAKVASREKALRPKKNMFVSGNPTLPSKTPPTLKFLCGFWKKYFENGEKISKKTYIFMIYWIFFFKKTTYRPTLPNFFQTVTRNRHIFLLDLIMDEPRCGSIMDIDKAIVLDDGWWKNNVFIYNETLYIGYRKY